MYGDDAEGGAEKIRAFFPKWKRMLGEHDEISGPPSPFEALAFAGSHITTLILIPCSASACLAFQRNIGVSVAGDFVSS